MSSDGDKAYLLALAALDGDVGKVRALLKAGTSANARAKQLMNAPALYAAAQNGHVEVARVLLDAGADPNGGTTDNATPLLAAVMGPDTRKGEELISLLLAYGADPSPPTATGFTPLHGAATLCRSRHAELLLAGGADLRALMTGEGPGLAASLLDVVGRSLRPGSGDPETLMTTFLTACARAPRGVDEALRRRLLAVRATARVPSGMAPSTVLLVVRALHGNPGVLDSKPRVAMAINPHTRYLVRLHPILELDPETGLASAAQAYPGAINAVFRGFLGEGKGESGVARRPTLILVECRELARRLRGALDDATAVRCVRPDASFNEATPDDPSDEAFYDGLRIPAFGGPGRVLLQHVVEETTAEIQKQLFPAVADARPAVPLSACSFERCGTLCPMETLKVCSRCRAASYCNEACQRGAWKAHKGDCHAAADGTSTTRA